MHKKGEFYLNLRSWHVHWQLPREIKQNDNNHNIFLSLSPKPPSKLETLTSCVISSWPLRLWYSQGKFTSVFSRNYTVHGKKFKTIFPFVSSDKLKLCLCSKFIYYSCSHKISRGASQVSGHVLWTPIMIKTSLKAYILEDPWKGFPYVSIVM